MPKCNMLDVVVSVSKRPTVYETNNTDIKSKKTIRHKKRND